MEIATRRRIEPQTGVAFELNRGDLLRVIDVQGEQVSDLMAFAPDCVECLSSGRSIDYNETIYLTTGHVLYSNRSTPMLTIVEDSVGRHDILYAPCSPEMFQQLYGYGPEHPSCFGNLAGALAAFGVEPDRILFTGDSLLDDYVAGQKVGLAVCLLDRSDRYFAMQSVRRITSLGDLLPLAGVSPNS